MLFNHVLKVNSIYQIFKLVSTLRQHQFFTTIVCSARDMCVYLLCCYLCKGWELPPCPLELFPMFWVIPHIKIIIYFGCVGSISRYVLIMWSEVKVAQSCPTLCDPMEDTVHGILQARILEWVAIPFSRGPSQPGDQTQVSCTAGRFFTSWATREALVYVQ